MTIGKIVVLERRGSVVRVMSLNKREEEELREASGGPKVKAIELRGEE